MENIFQDPKPMLQINAVRSNLKAWLHPIQNHIVFKVEDFDEDYNDFYEEMEYEYNSAGIMLDKKRAVALRDKLSELIEKMSD